jgi:thiamine biosynthesis lipoprotein
VSDLVIRTVPMMGTVVSIQIVGHGSSDAARIERESAIDRALEWFSQVEACCTRFDDQSELRRLCVRVGEPVVVSDMLFAPLHFALTVAAESGGAFDPTVGGPMEARGFDANHRTGTLSRSAGAAASGASFRDVVVDPAERSVTILRPLTLDLGAVAKGLAMDLAARELQPFGNFAIDAGGDLYLGGTNAAAEAWTAGIRHPREERAVIETIRLSNVAVCTSGDYERAGVATDSGHHILDPRANVVSGAEISSVLGASGQAVPSATAVASATVIAPSAMVADALATAAFVLGPVAGLTFLEQNGVRGVMFTSTLQRLATKDFNMEHPELDDAAVRRT